ncbi:MAG: glutathione S-transferase family protein, partial [Hyphomicrobiales bacterium]|nr:glutathione S-transferase family protein [Hyphomicrobiales bacterium]
MKPAQPILLHGFKLSGHSHRAELMLRLLDLPFTFREVDLAGGEQNGAAFRKLNPLGTVPMIEDGGVVVPDSVAILAYLASKYDESGAWLPSEPAKFAKVQRWLSVAQGPVFNGPCSARLVTLFKAPLDHERAVKVANGFFKIFDAELAGRRFLAGDRPTIADVAVYSYVALSPEGGVS